VKDNVKETGQIKEEYVRQGQALSLGKKKHLLQQPNIT